MITDGNYQLPSICKSSYYTWYEQLGIEYICMVYERSHIWHILYNKLTTLSYKFGQFDQLYSTINIQQCFKCNDINILLIYFCLLFVHYYYYYIIVICYHGNVCCLLSTRVYGAFIMTLYIHRTTEMYLHVYARVWD